jgi:putative membrane protein
MSARRFPRSVFDRGVEPDPRFTLANERTFLAWIGTALALLAGGVALESVALGLNPILRLTASTLLVLAGIATPIQAWVGWMRAERALRESRPLPSIPLSLPLAVVVVCVGALVIIGVALQ